MVEHKTFHTPEEITEFLNERDTTVNVYPEVVNISCDNNGLWHLFYIMKYYINDWFDVEEEE